MPSIWGRVLGSIAVTLAIGGIVGAYFGSMLIGLLVAMSIVLALHLYRLISLEATLSARKRVRVPDGDGIWARVLAGIRYQQQRVRRHKGRHRRLMKEVRQSTNALPDGVVALTDDNEIQRFNAAAQLMLGLKRRRDRGQRIDNLLRHPDFVNYLGSGDYEVPVILPSPRREDGWLSARLVPYSQESRLLILRDVTERTRLSRMRSDFVANASHELRTPLTVISGYLDAMETDADDALRAWQKPLREMTQQALRMRAMLDELLALSKLEASAAASNDKPVDIGMIIRETKALYDNDTRSIEAKIETVAQVLGEYTELTSVVSNLISNAVRYSPEDSQIRVSWRQVESGAELCVEDDGDGISPEDVPRLTERFFRVNRGRGRDSGGVGLGLAIVKHALARHGAYLKIDSELGHGSQFRCLFPEERIVAPEASGVRLPQG
ncbi:MAG: phosphate regulon sensor histidine kinase PhoR [Pseudomonadota bacterium]